MPNEEYASIRARLQSELEAARLERAPPPAQEAVARELLEAALKHDALGDARAALDELEATLDPDDPACPVIVDHHRARIAIRAGDWPLARAAAARGGAAARELGLDGDLPHLLDQLADACAASELEEEARSAREEAATAFESSEQYALAGMAWCWLAEHGPRQSRTSRASLTCAGASGTASRTSTFRRRRPWSVPSPSGARPSYRI
jgi:hypothetical protein